MPRVHRGRALPVWQMPPDNALSRDHRTVPPAEARRHEGLPTCPSVKGLPPDGLGSPLPLWRGSMAITRGRNFRSEIAALIAHTGFTVGEDLCNPKQIQENLMKEWIAGRSGYFLADFANATIISSSTLAPGELNFVKGPLPPGRSARAAPPIAKRHHRAAAVRQAAPARSAL